MARKIAASALHAAMVCRSSLLWSLWLLPLYCLLPSASCYEALSIYNSSLTADSSIVDLIPPETCNFTLFVILPPDNYSVLAADGSPLASYGELCINSTAPLNGSTTVTHDFGDFEFETFAYIIYDAEVSAAVCGNDSLQNVILPVVCAYENLPSDKRRVRIPLGPVVFSLFFTSIALICSSAMIITYSLFKQLRTLPGQTVLNLAVAFFVSDTISVMFVSIVLDGHPPDPLLFIFEIGFYHVRFMWMAIVGFEISRHIYLGMTLKFDSPTKKRRILGTYLALGWGAPVIVGIITIAVEYSGAEAHRKRPLFAANGNIVVFLPIALTLVFNVAVATFLVVSLRRAATRRNKFGSTVTRGTVKFSRVFLIILTVLGLTWFSVFISLTTSEQSHAMQYIFILLNTTQPIYVCVAFLGNRKTVGHYTVLFGCRKQPDTSELYSSSIILRRRMSRFISSFRSEREFRTFRNASSQTDVRRSNRAGSVLTYMSSFINTDAPPPEARIANEITSSGNKESDSSNDSGVAASKNYIPESVSTYVGEGFGTSLLSPPTLMQSLENIREDDLLYSNIDLSHELPRPAEAVLYSGIVEMKDEEKEPVGVRGEGRRSRPSIIPLTEQPSTESIDTPVRTSRESSV